MFKKNPRHVQPYLISNVNDLPEKQRKLLETSWSGTFFREFYSRVDEQPSQRRRHKCDHRDRALQQGQARQLYPGVDYGGGVHDCRPSLSLQRCRAGEEEREAYLHNILN